jgi:FtsZ-binding cell division protein ZapB
MAEVSKIDEALDRFEAALKRLEAAVRRAHEGGSFLPPETQELLREREQLVQEMSAVRVRANEFAERNRNAASKIDSAMARIKSVLG